MGAKAIKEAMPAFLEGVKAVAAAEAAAEANHENVSKQLDADPEVKAARATIAAAQAVIEGKRKALGGAEVETALEEHRSAFEAMIAAGGTKLRIGGKLFSLRHGRNKQILFKELKTTEVTA